ncbi:MULTISPECIES: polysaccharide deacetylase family protein [unclassified Rhizobium]|uniref:polysaccharide deacetylase family protein n=1 Tax=unclassified Rhizobium TaxID=2613769 RepID=UPI001ADA9099|nr:MULTISPECIES: polysaccharide deacetylase family protein [unclassified Rhizobium]MBO9126859.1 polysaccharide deacetylase family protein [Rhizobium sp. 16-488-2b]MBO9177306.1 polysaccharide deacetylase family protein [Rhizobium sp. 16-488-2a]
MMAHDIWAPLRAELDRWQAVGKAARLWLRDDDAIEPTPALEQLLKLTKDANVPLTLAVIPASTGEALAARLADERQVMVALHGWSHTNHAGPDEKKQELGAHRAPEVVLGELRDGFAILQRLFGPRFISMLVPPWNRINGALIAELPALGLETLSVYGAAKAGSPIRLLNTHVDIMNWHGIRGGRPHDELIADMVRELRARFDHDAEPIGILTHHLVHDETAWAFLADLLAETSAHPAVAWKSAAALVGA